MGFPPLTTSKLEMLFQRVNSILKSPTQAVLAGEPQCHPHPVPGCHASAGDSSQCSPAAQNGNPKSPSDVAVWAESPPGNRRALRLWRADGFTRKGFIDGKEGFCRLPRWEQTGLGVPPPTPHSGRPQVRFAPGVNPRMCTDKGQDLFPTETSLSTEQG